MTDSKTPKSELGKLYLEMRLEIEAAGKAKSVEPGAPGERERVAFPDPIELSAIDRRRLVKSIFSFIEGIAFAMKRMALAANNTDMLTAGQRALALGHSYELKDSGEVVTRPAKLKTLSNVRFAFQIFAAVEGISFRLDASGTHWQMIQRSLKVRDRLTHPKGVVDLGVSDSEIREAMQAFIWFDVQLILILADSLERLRAKTASLLLLVEEKRAGRISSPATETGSPDADD